MTTVSYRGDKAVNWHIIRHELFSTGTQISSLLYITSHFSFLKFSVVLYFPDLCKFSHIFVKERKEDETSFHLIGKRIIVRENIVSAVIYSVGPSMYSSENFMTLYIFTYIYIHANSQIEHSHNWYKPTQKAYVMQCPSCVWSSWYLHAVREPA